MPNLEFCCFTKQPNTYFCWFSMRTDSLCAERFNEMLDTFRGGDVRNS